MGVACPSGTEDEIFFQVSFTRTLLAVLFDILLSTSGGSVVKNPPAMWETWVRSLSWEDPLEKGMATDDSILAWRIPWTV